MFAPCKVFFGTHMSFQKTISIYLRRARRKVCDAFINEGAVSAALSFEVYCIVSEIFV